MGFVGGDVSVAWDQAYRIPGAVAFTGVGDIRRTDRETLVAGIAIGRHRGSMKTHSSAFGVGLSGSPSLPRQPLDFTPRHHTGISAPNRVGAGTE